MPRRKSRVRSGSVSRQDVEALRAAIREGWPWRIREDEKFRQVPLDTRRQIMLSHLTGIFTLPCGFPTDPHPSDETIEFLYSELIPDLEASEKKFGKYVPMEDRWSSEDLRETNIGQRELY